MKETMFRGHKTGFNPKGSNETTPNDMGPPSTKFGGRPAVPAGPLKRYPGAVADIENGNRRLSKSGHGDGGGSGTRFSTTNAFGGAMNKGMKSGGSPGGDGKGRGAMKANKK